VNAHHKVSAQNLQRFVADHVLFPLLLAHVLDHKYVFQFNGKDIIAAKLMAHEKEIMSFDDGDVELV
jgi:hypothetical protein